MRVYLHGSVKYKSCKSVNISPKVAQEVRIIPCVLSDVRMTPETHSRFSKTRAMRHDLGHAVITLFRSIRFPIRPGAYFNSKWPVRMRARVRFVPAKSRSRQNWVGAKTEGRMRTSSC